MIALAVVPLVVTLLARWTAAAIVRRCSAQWAARCLVVVALSAASSVGLALCAVAALGLSQIPFVADAGGWSADAVSDRVRIPWPVAVVLTLLALALIVAAATQVIRTARALVRASGMCRALDPNGTGLVVVDDDRVRACAVPGRPGRILVSRSLLDELSVPERRAVLAHETAHLRHGHVGYVHAAELAAAANPLLAPVPAAVRLAVESWADNAAVAAVGDPCCVVRALARASLRCATMSAPASRVDAAGLSMATDTDLAARIGNLLDHRSPRARLPFVVASALAASVSLVTAGAVGLWAHGLFEFAQAHR